jgi:hypothetical protein
VTRVVRIFFLPVIANAIAGPALSKDWPDSIEHACILDAARQLPNIPGLQVKSAQIAEPEKAVADRALKRDMSSIVVIRLSINAATIDCIMVYFCTWNKAGNAITQFVNVQ